MSIQFFEKRTFWLLGQARKLKKMKLADEQVIDDLVSGKIKHDEL